MVGSERMRLDEKRGWSWMRKDGWEVQVGWEERRKDEERGWGRIRRGKEG